MTSPQTPSPAVEEPQDNPGGPDAVEHDDGPGGPTGRDLPPDDNATTDDLVPEELTEPDDKEQGPDEGVSGEGPVPDEPPA